MKFQRVSVRKHALPENDTALGWRRSSQTPKGKHELKCKVENTEWTYCWGWWKRMNPSNHVLNSQFHLMLSRLTHLKSNLIALLELCQNPWVIVWDDDLAAVTDLRIRSLPNSPVLFVVMKTQSTDNRERCAAVTRFCSFTTLSWMWFTITILT